MVDENAALSSGIYNPIVVEADAVPAMAEKVTLVVAPEASVDVTKLTVVGKRYG